MKIFAKPVVIFLIALVVSWLQTAFINQWFSYLPFVHVPLLLLTVMILTTRKHGYVVWAAGVGAWSELTSSEASGVWLILWILIAQILKRIFRTGWDSASFPAIATLSALASLLYISGVLTLMLMMPNVTKSDLWARTPRFLLEGALSTTISIVLCLSVNRVFKLLRTPESI